MTPHVQLRVHPGDVLAGKYRVERVLGSGGMGVVVAAHHVQLDEKVAIKFLLSEALFDPEALVRFDREARAAVEIKSEHVARVIDVGTLENGAPYMVMEYLDGCDLSAWLETRGRLSVEDAVDFVLQACEAVAEAHVLGIVHRDLKPANLFCIRRMDGQLSIKVLDFGISKLTSSVAAQDVGVTRSSSILGSPRYMSPEQMQSSRSVDPRTDIWSLGIILFELVTGGVPFNAEGVFELALKLTSEQAPSLCGLRPDAPAELERVIARCLEKERDRRYATVGELALDLRPLGSSRARVSVNRILGTFAAAGKKLDSQSHLSLAPPAFAATVASTTPWHMKTRSRAVRRAMVIVLPLIAAIVVGGTALRRKTAPLGQQAGQSDEAAPTIQAAPAVPPPVAATARAPSILSESAPPPRASASAVAVAAPAELPVPDRGARPGAAIRPTHAPKPAIAHPPAPKVDCDPPYVLDGEGNKKWKRECL